ncbi:MAG TPA: hypothetical protein VEZ41_04485 [Allosphingosinicella sp.]|nr:hypothetical protein [Allosphingosinicella sp.]
MGFALLLTAAAGQPPQGAPTPPPAFIQAAQAFGQCLQGGAAKLAATVTPEAGATQVVAGCKEQRTMLGAQFEVWISGPGFPEEARTPAREEFQSQLSQVESQVADGIRRLRAAPAGAPKPSN